jgi:hypothetical protein
VLGPDRPETDQLLGPRPGQLLLRPGLRLRPHDCQTVLRRLRLRRGSGGGGHFFTTESGEARLLNADRAIIDVRKITDYALNPQSTSGGADKARVFESALGYNLSNYEGLLAQIQAGVSENAPMAGQIDRYGSRFTVDIPVTGPNGSAIVRTGWIYDPGSTVPRLVTLYVK